QRSCLKIERRAEMGPHGDAKALVIAEQPRLTFCSTKGYDQKVCIARVDCGDDRIAAHVFYGSETRTKRADAGDAAIFGIKNSACGSGDPVGATEEEHPQLSPPRLGSQFVENISPRYAFPDW